LGEGWGALGLVLGNPNKEKRKMLNSYRELLVWQKAIDLAIETYSFTEVFPRTEIYGLTSQLRRASVSVPSNIAEGYGRGSRKEYLQFLCVAQGSLKELETQTILADRLRYASEAAAARVLEQSEVVGKMLGSLIRSLRAKNT
jgi:four helix bundle protein